jgi:DNA-binding NarL/FixJ family response regulator
MPATARTRILVVDDHPIVRLGICNMIAAEPDLEVCGEADSARAALRLAASTRPDLAIVDLSLAEGVGLELIQALRVALPKLHVLVLSMHDETLFADRVLRAGANGYIMKREAITGLVGAIRQVMAGRVYLSAAMTQRMLGRVGRHGAPADLLSQLTNREFEVFELIGRGLGSAAIGEQLHVSVKTVETYRSNIKSKLNLKNAAELVRFAAIWAVQR